MPKSRRDEAQSDYRAGEFVVFDDRLEFNEEKKVMFKEQMRIPMHDYASVYHTDLHREALTAIRKQKMDGSFYVLVREATRREIDASLRGKLIRPGSVKKRRRSAEELQREILRRLDEVQAALEQLKPAHGGMGHNRPPEILLDPEIQGAGVQAARDLTEEFQKPEPDRGTVQSKTGVLKTVANQIRDFAKQVAKAAKDKAAKSLGDKAFTEMERLVHEHAMAAVDRIVALIRSVSEWL